MHNVTDLVKKPVVRLNVDDNPFPNMSFAWNGKTFSHILDKLNLDEITSVWYRLAYLQYFNEKPGTYDMLNRLCREEMVFQLQGILPNALWVSNPSCVKSADNKQLQLEVAVDLGMIIPQTLVTSSSEEVATFRARLGRIVVKPVAKQVIRDEESKYHAIFTNRILPETPVDFSLLSSSPAIFQQEIEREFDIRTVVVGEQVFSMSIKQVGEKAGDVDYRDQRGKNLECARYDLPRDLQKKCVELVKHFNLKYSSMDFILGKDGIHYFLENNPNGAWLFVQNGGNHPIAEALAKVLD